MKLLIKFDTPCTWEEFQKFVSIIEDLRDEFEVLSVDGYSNTIQAYLERKESEAEEGAGIRLHAEEPDGFKKFYECFKQDFLKFLEKYQEFTEKHGREPNENELRSLIEDWLKEEEGAEDAEGQESDKDKPTQTGGPS